MTASFDVRLETCRTVAEIATILRVSKMTVYRLVSSGQLDAYRFGGTIRVPESALHGFLGRNALFATYLSSSEIICS